MKQLKIKDLEKLIEKLKIKYPEDYKEIPVYLGEDDELNGIHTGWYCQEINEKNEEDKEFIELINEDYSNIEFKEKAVLIS